MMKAHSLARSKGSSKVSTQQAVFELKQKVNLALNKLADRDTYQIGVDELEKTAERLTPDKIPSFLSCIVDTDSEQKSAVRKECIRLMSTLARVHEGLVGPYLGKMVTSIVKRLKDQDSVVREACIETIGVLASRLSNFEDESSGAFVVLVKPLFEALGEQYKQVIAGAALCLASIIDNTHDPPSSILQRMLTRTTKLLKNPHFMAKPAVIELNRSIIMAGGATTHIVLTAAMASIQEALKNSDWNTRKAASVALGDIASSGASFLESFKASCIRSLESCRFDKVKPVRETALHALQYWRSLPGPGTSEPFEAGSFIKENSCAGDRSDLTNNGDSGWKDVPRKKAVLNSAASATRRKPLSISKTSQNYMEEHQHSKEDDWHIDIAIPMTHNVALANHHDEESEGSSVTKTLERMTTDITGIHDIGYEFVPMDDKRECSTVSKRQNDNFRTKIKNVSPVYLTEGSSQKPMGRDQRFAVEITCEEEEVYSTKLQDRRSLDSTVTESSAPTGCCSQMVNDMVCIRKQLMEIENKQSSLMDILQVFSSGIMETLLVLQSKVLSLEHVVGGIAQDLVLRGNCSDLVNSREMKQEQGVSPRLSTSTARTTVDSRNRQPSSLTAKVPNILEEKVPGRVYLSSSVKQRKEVWTDHAAKNSRNPLDKDVKKSLVQGTQIMRHARKSGVASASDSVSLSSSNSWQSRPVGKHGLWQNVKNFLCEGDLNSAYAETLSSGSEAVLIELLDRTGPVLESLSDKTICDILSILASYLLEQRFLNTIIPWLQQVVELSSANGPNHFIFPPNVRREFLSAVEEAMNMEFSNPAERRSVTQLAMKLHQAWGKCS